jgi:hypothetical protein
MALDLKPADLPADWKQQIEQYKKWITTFVGKTPEFVKIKCDEEKKPTDYEALKKELSQWKIQFFNKTPEQIKADLDAKPTTSPLTAEQQNKLNSYDALKKERDDLLVKLSQKPKENLTSLSKKIADEIIKAYKAPRYLFSYYLKLIKTFQDWEIYGTDEQKQASKQNKADLERVIKFLTDYHN